MKEEHKFQLEFEGFKQKASWENKVFYTFLAFVIGVLTFYISENKTNELSFWIWLGVLAILLIVGEFLIHKYLDKQKEEIERRFR